MKTIQSKNNQIHLFLRALIVFVLLVPIIWSCTSGGAKDLEEPDVFLVKKVNTIPADQVDYRYTVVASGLLASKEEARLSFKTGGIIRQILVQEGQVVRKNQLLAKLDLDEIEAQAQQARLGEKQASSQLANAQLGFEKAERDFANIQGLFQDSVATVEQLKDSRTLLNNAKNQMEAAEAGLQFAQKGVDVADFNLRYSRIVAPSRGTILSKMAEVNELATPGRPIFLFGSSAKAQVIRVNLTDKDIINVNLGDSATVSFDAYAGTTFPGIVREISSKADPMTNTFEVEVEVLPQGSKLLSGFVGKVEIRTSVKEKVVRVPVDALISADGNNGLIYIEKNGRVSERRINILRLLDEDLLVRSGVQAGEQIVIEGGSYLEENDSVLIGKN